MMDIIDHGEWVGYTPEKHWLLAHNVLFAKRVSDGVDWYEYQRSTDILTSNTVKLTLMRNKEGELVVMSTQRDGSMIWPLDTRLIEIDFSGDHETLRQKRFDFGKREFMDAIPFPKQPLLQALAEEMGVDVTRLTAFLKRSL